MQLCPEESADFKLGFRFEITAILNRSEPNILKLIWKFGDLSCEVSIALTPNMSHLTYSFGGSRSLA